MKILCIIGPSGAGKSLLVNILHARGLVAITPSYTDRPRRSGEAEVEHTFVTPKEFDALDQASKFLETVQPFGLPYRYGLPAVAEVDGRVSLIMLRAPFVPALQKFYPDYIVYQIEAPQAFVATQLKKRVESEQGTRLTDYDKEVALGRTLASRIFVNEGSDISLLVDEVIESIQIDFNSTLNQIAYKRAGLTDTK